MDRVKERVKLLFKAFKRYRDVKKVIIVDKPYYHEQLAFPLSRFPSLKILIVKAITNNLLYPLLYVEPMDETQVWGI